MIKEEINKQETKFSSFDCQMNSSNLSPALRKENEIEEEPTEELINRTLDTIQAKWDKKSEEAEEDGEGTVDFDVLLDEVKEALIFVFKKGKASNQKDVLKIIENWSGIVNKEELKSRIKQK